MFEIVGLNVGLNVGIYKMKGGKYFGKKSFFLKGYKRLHLCWKDRFNIEWICERFVVSTLPAIDLHDFHTGTIDIEHRSIDLHERFFPIHCG